MILYRDTYEDGGEAFQDDSKCRLEIIVKDDLSWLVNYKTTCVQGQEIGESDDLETAVEMAQEKLIEVFKKYKSKLNKSDRGIFKRYFERC